MVKVTFTLDEQTIERLRRTASRLAKPQSYVVREAVREYEARSTKLSDEERARMLAIVDRMVREPPTRTARNTEGPLINRSRVWSRRSPDRSLACLAASSQTRTPRRAQYRRWPA